MRSIAFRLVALLLLISLFIFSGCTENESPNQDASQQEETEKTIILTTCSEAQMNIYRAFYQETGLNPVIESTYDSKEHVYKDVTLNPYYAVGFGEYYILTEEEYKSIQDYQNRTGIQVIYPTVKYQDRAKYTKYTYDANIYFELDSRTSAGTLTPVLDDNGDFIPNYWTYAVDSEKPVLVEEYNTIRIEGESGVSINGVNYYYAYGRKTEYGIEVRMLKYTYYEYLKETSQGTVPSEEQFFDFS